MNDQPLSALPRPTESGHLVTPGSDGTSAIVNRYQFEITTPTALDGRLEVSNHDYLARFDDATISRLRVYEDLAADSMVRCLCNPSRDCRLYVRNYDSTFHLAKHPHTASEHAPDCIFSLLGVGRPTSLSGFHAIANLQISDLSLGSLLTPATRLTKRRSASVSLRRPSTNRASRAKPSKGAGIILSLINTAGLNEFGPGASPQTWTSVAARLAQAASITRVGNRHLRSDLMVAGLDAEAEIVQRLRAPSPTTVGDGPRTALIGRMVKVNSRVNGHRDLEFDGLVRPVVVTDSSYRYSINHSTYKDASAEATRVGTIGAAEEISFVIASLDANGNLVGTRLSTVFVSPDWIPVASSFELQFSNHLALLKHRFLKPLRLASFSPFLHDFVLLGLLREYPIEVNGMSSNPEYVATKDVVAAHLRVNFPDHHAIWWPDRGEPLPVLPAPGKET